MNTTDQENTTMSKTHDMIASLQNRAENLLAEARRLVDFASTITDEDQRDLVYEEAHSLISEAGAARATARNLLSAAEAWAV